MKPQLKEPALKVYFHGPSQSSICLCIIFFDLTLLYIRVYPHFTYETLILTRFESCFSVEGNFFFCMSQLMCDHLAQFKIIICMACSVACTINKLGIFLICSRQYDCLCPFFVCPLCQLEVIHGWKQLLFVLFVLCSSVIVFLWKLLVF